MVSNHPSSAQMRGMLVSRHEWFKLVSKLGEGWVEVGEKVNDLTCAKYYGVSGGGSGGGGDDAEDDLVEARIPKDILKKIMPVAIKEGLSVRQTVVLTSAFLVGSGVDLQDFVLSTATCHTFIAQQCSSIGDDALNKFAEEVKKK